MSLCIAVFIAPISRTYQIREKTEAKKKKVKKNVRFY